jgi:hypothetical protein
MSAHQIAARPMQLLRSGRKALCFDQYDANEAMIKGNLRRNVLHFCAYSSAA